jgi:gluconolactonase
MMLRQCLILSTLLAVTIGFAQEPKEPELPPKGETFSFTFEKSKVFPGTTRSVRVYIPKLYDGKTPACVYVGQDGGGFNETAVFDRLIAEKSMPVTIGVFVTPGQVKAANKDALPRFNRSYEYDGLGGDYAKFLLEDGRAIILSKSGNDRAIGGSSSGAVCAFTAAWERPDGFTRVFSAIGTYVGLRGANAYPTLIRKYEPKPIRIFLQDGSKDQDIYGGDWWMANQEMERSLKFAGYEVDHEWGEEGHSNAHGTRVFPKAMKWLWAGYPKPVAAGLGSQQMREILIPGEGWKLVGEGYKFTEGPATNAKGEMFFNDVGASKTYKIDADGKPVVFLDNSKGGDGQRFGPDGRLYANATAEKKVIAWDAEGKPTTIAEGFRGNDLVVLHNGAIYDTDPFETSGKSKVYYISPNGEKKVVDTGLKFANGITVSPDQTLLYVADSWTHWVYSYQIKPDGTLAGKQKYYHLHTHDRDDDTGADGMRVDRDGRLWVATKIGLQVCDQAGRVMCIIPTPNGKIANLTFGGPNMDVIVAACGDKVYSRKVKVKGANAFEAPFKPQGPRL